MANNFRQETVILFLVMDIRVIVSMIESLRREQADLDRVIAGFEELARSNDDANGGAGGVTAKYVRGHEGTIILVDHGKFESMVPYITVKPQVTGGKMVDGKMTGAKAIGGDAYASKWGTTDIQIPIDQKDMMTAHIENFLGCMRTRQKPHLDVETGAKAVVVINLATESYREGKVMYWDEKNRKSSDKPVKS